MNETPLERENGQEPVITVGQWLKLLCIRLFSLIPVVGWMIMLILYIVKASDAKQPRSLRNAVIAGFIFNGAVVAVSIALTVIFVILIIHRGQEIANWLSDWLYNWFPEFSGGYDAPGGGYV